MATQHRLVERAPVGPKSRTNDTRRFRRSLQPLFVPRPEDFQAKWSAHRGLSPLVSAAAQCL